MMLLLVAILVVASISLLLNAGYILHELGWFPHGKFRGPTSFLEKTMHGGHWPSREECRQTDVCFIVQSPHLSTLRRHVYSEFYAEGDPVARIEKVLKRWRENPSFGRREDLINVMNDITKNEELSAKVQTLIDEAFKEVLIFDVNALAERGESHV